MRKVSEEVILDWIKNEKRIHDRIRRIEKQLKKYNKQKIHFQFRVACIAEYKKRNK